MRVSLEKHFKELKENNLLEKIEEIFGDFKKGIVEEWHVYYEMGRKVIY